MPEPRYLGDAVYASVMEGDVLVLTTNHHDTAEAISSGGMVIYLEPEVARELVRYIREAYPQIP